MKFKSVFLPAVLVLFGLSGNTSALETMEKDIKEGCASEIKKYCSDIRLGEGRLLSCFHSREAELSGRCSHTLYQASVKLEQAAVALNYVAGECKEDIRTHCPDVELGEGRVEQCLKSNSAKVSAGCKQAWADVFE